MTAPLANLLCVSDRDPSRLDALADRLRCGGDFEILRPRPRWLVGVAPLPPTAGIDGREHAPSPDLVFCEGADRVLAPGVDPAKAAALALEQPRRLASLPGDFTFLAFGSGDALTAVRSCGGLVPLYLRRGEGAIAIATRLDYLVRFCEEEPVLDPLVNGIWSTGWTVFPDNRTFLRGVSIIPRGHWVQATAETASPPRQYWDPRPPQGAALEIDPQRPAQLRQVLLDSLQRDLDPRGGNLLTLSGGVDSSALAALIAGTLDLPLASLSFMSAVPEVAARDGHFIDAITERFAIEPQRRVTLDMPTIISLLERPQRSCCAILHSALCLLEELSDEFPVRVLVGGEYADEIVGTFAHFDDWALDTSLRNLIAVGPRNWPTGSARDPLRWAKRRLQRAAGRVWLPVPDRLPPLFRRELREEYSEWRERLSATARADRRPLRQLAASGAQEGFVTMNWEATSALGIRRSVPFFSREALELAFTCHPSEKVGPGPKKLLRAAVAGDVPAENLNRSDKGVGVYPPPVTLHWSHRLDPLLAPIVREDWFPKPPTELDDFDALRLAVLRQVAASVSGFRAPAAAAA